MKPVIKPYSLEKSDSASKFTTVDKSSKTTTISEPQLSYKNLTRPRYTYQQYLYKYLFSRTRYTYSYNKYVFVYELNM